MIDFKIERDDLGQVIDNNGSYKIEMDGIYNNELPIIIDDVEMLYTQSLCLFPTINKNQMPLDENYGVDVEAKSMLTQQGVFEAGMLSILEDVSNMISDMFVNNNEMLEWALVQRSLVFNIEAKEI